MRIRICQRCGKLQFRKSKIVEELDAHKKPTGFVHCSNAEKCKKRRGVERTITLNSKFDQRIQSLL